MGPQGVGIIAKAMCKNISVHTLDLSGNDVLADPVDEDDDPEAEEEDPVFGEMLQSLEALSETVKKNKFLRVISLRHNRIKGEIDEAGEDDGAETPLGKFLEPLKKYHRIEVLDLSSNELGAGGARMVSAALQQNHSVKVLDLSDNDLGPKGLRHIATLLKASGTVESLVLRKTNIVLPKKGKRAQKEALEAMQSFAAALAANKSLKSLAIGQNHMGPDLGELLLSSVDATRLEELCIEGNDICGYCLGEFDGKALFCLARFLAFPQCPLKRLFISGNNIQQRGVDILLADPNAMHSLEVLDISRSRLCDGGISALSQRIGDLPRLHTIDLSYNDFSDPSPIARALRVTDSIEHVTLEGNYIGDCPSPDALITLIDSISSRKQVRSLNVNRNELNDDHARALAFFCHTATPPFSRLYAQHNPAISLPETIKMLQALSRNVAIEVLKVTAQEGDHFAVLEALLGVLENNSHLKDVDCGLSLDVLDDNAVKKIQQKLLQNALLQEGT
jgi:Ran GTPase-activating protein (RanGAP) involved in mRNA processing and transport